MYLWWSRLAGHDGLSAVARPGVPAVALTLAGASGLPLAAVTAGLEVCLGVALGLACWALARAAGAERWVASLAGVLGGTFGVHLASGYLATLAFAVAFVGGATVVARGGRRRTVAAIAAFAAATLSHPLFGPLGAAIVAGAAALSWRDARDEAVRLGAALAGGTLLTLLALGALAFGSDPLSVVTSRDGYLRRASGLGEILRDAYLDRLVQRWTRYVQWVSLPLAAFGWRRPSGIAARVLWSWVAVTLLGVTVAAATGLLPPDRFITFGIAIPILTAFGLERVAAAFRDRRTPAVALTATLAVAMLAGAAIAWTRQTPFLDDREVRQVAIADRVASRTALGTTLFFLVDEPDETVSFLAARAANVVRAVVDPSRIRDVVVVVPRSVDPPPERAAVEEQTNADLRAVRRARRPTVGFRLAAFGEAARGAGRPTIPGNPWTSVASGVATTSPGATATTPSSSALEPTSPGVIALASALALLVFAASGYGWLRAVSVARIEALALAPAFGWAAFVLAGIALERVGVPLVGWAGPAAVSAVAVLGGFASRFVLERRAAADPAA